MYSLEERDGWLERARVDYEMEADPAVGAEMDRALFADYQARLAELGLARTDVRFGSATASEGGVDALLVPRAFADDGSVVFDSQEDAAAQAVAERADRFEGVLPGLVSAAFELHRG